ATTRVRALPGVEAAGAISFLPFAGLGAATGFNIVGQPPFPPGQGFGVNVSVCDNGYFETMRQPLRRGRLFTARELRERSNVVVINEEMARRAFPNTDAIGQQLVIDIA